MAPGQVQIDGRMFELGVPEKHLDGAQIGACFKHMRGETVSQRMGRYVLLDAGLLGCLCHSRPNDLLSNRHVSPPVVYHAWEQVGLGLHPAPVLSQSVQKLGSQQNIAIAAGLGLEEAQQLRSQTARLKQLYSDHIQVEETIVFTRAIQVLHSHAIAAIATEFRFRRK